MGRKREAQEPQEAADDHRLQTVAHVLRSSSAKRGKAEEDSFYTSIGAYGLYHQAGGKANRSCKNEKVGR